MQDDARWQYFNILNVLLWNFTFQFDSTYSKKHFLICLRQIPGICEYSFNSIAIKINLLINYIYAFTVHRIVPGGFRSRLVRKAKKTFNFLLLVAGVTWLKYCRHGVKHWTVNNKPISFTWNEFWCMQMETNCASYVYILVKIFSFLKIWSQHLLHSVKMIIHLEYVNVSKQRGNVLLLSS